MTANDFSQTEVDERAYAIFLIEGIQYFLDQDPPLREGSILNYCDRLWNRWRQMSQNEKLPFLDRALEELRRLRRYHRHDIYRSLIRDEIVDDTRRRRPPTHG
jgi:hypothetical protein